MSARHVATCRDMSARHVEDIIEIIGLKRHEMSCLHDMSATCRGILVGLVNGSMLGGYDRLSASRLLRNKNINKCAINILRPYPPSIDLYYDTPITYTCFIALVQS